MTTTEDRWLFSAFGSTSEITASKTSSAETCRSPGPIHDPPSRLAKVPVGHSKPSLGSIDRVVTSANAPSPRSTAMGDALAETSETSLLSEVEAGEAVVKPCLAELLQPATIAIASMKPPFRARVSLRVRPLHAEASEG